MATITATHERTRKYYPSIRAAWIPLLALCLAFFVEMVDNTLLTIALPTIGRELGGSTLALQWITAAYSLTFGGLLLTAGSIADRYGRKKVLMIGLVLFGLLSLGVIWVSTANELIALRAALGIAAAMMAPITNSLVFRLFKDDKLRRQAMTIMIVVGMSGFVLGPLLGGTVLAHLGWQWLLLVNAPIALIALIGVKLGVPTDDKEDLTSDKVDIPGALLSMSTIGLACYTATSGVENGWFSFVTLACALGAIASLTAFIWRQRTARYPMLELGLFKSGPVRGAAIAQIGAAIAMAGVMFSLILHFQYAYGWSPMRAGLANLPIIITMLGATPVAEGLVKRYGQRITCVVGGIFLTGGLLLMAWAVLVGYAAIAVCMVLFTIGLRIVMTTAAIALIGAVPENRTSVGAALNDTAQEVGSSIGTALIGTLIATLIATVFPVGVWSSEFVALFFHGERIAFLVMAVVVGMVAIGGALVLTDSKVAEDTPTL